MATEPSPSAALARAGALCDLLRGGTAVPPAVLEELRSLGDAAAPALVDLLRDRGAGYAYAVRLLADCPCPEAGEALRETARDGGARECDRLEAAAALDRRGDPEGLAVLRGLSRRGNLRAAAFFILRDRPGGLSDEDLALGPYLDDDEVRPLAVEDLTARGYETGGTLDDPDRRARFREGWRAGTARAGRRP